MIFGFVGTPGSGKSYEAVLKGLDNLRIGKFKKIYTNIEGMDKPECLEAIKQTCNLTDYQLETRLQFLSQEETLEFWLHVENSSLIILDEVHKNFSNRDWSSDKNKGFTEWLSTHRHLGCDVVLITQDIEKIDKHARSLIEWTYLFRKVNFLGGAIQKKYMMYTYAGDDHNGRPVATVVRTYKQSVFACYKSFDNSEIKELGFMKSVNILKHPVFYSIPVMLLVVGVLFYKSSFSSGHLFTPIARASGLPTTEISSVEKAPVTITNHGQIVPVVSDVSTTMPEASLQVVTLYKKADGSMIWTNNGRPANSRFVRVL